MTVLFIHFPQSHLHIEPAALSFTELIPATALPFNRLQMPVDDISILSEEKILPYEMELITSVFEGNVWRERK